MKKHFLIFAFIFISFSTFGQVVSNITEGFDVSCTTLGPNYPLYWRNDNRIPPLPPLAWNCTPLGGRYGTPGIECNGYYSGIYYTNEAWLFTPKLDLVSYSNKIYLRFDSRYQFNAARLRVLASNEYITGINPDSISWIDLTSSMAPIFTPTDSNNWVTHWVDLSPFKGTPLYIAFKYNSTTAFAGNWTLDNIMTTTFPMSINDVNNDRMPLTVVGNSTSNSIQLMCPIDDAGRYTLEVKDLLGNTCFKRAMQLERGDWNYTIDGSFLPNALYVVTLSNQMQQGIAKTVILY
jgi:hypothetical protein